jgi:hypothetical protein
MVTVQPAMAYEKRPLAHGHHCRLRHWVSLAHDLHCDDPAANSDKRHKALNPSFPRCDRA